MQNSKSKVVSTILVTLAAVLWAFSLPARSATIEVTAQIGEVGCDLVEAINAANDNMPIGGCIANNGSFGDDLIVLNFSVPIDEFIVSTVNNSNSLGANGLPGIKSNMTILGRGTEPVVIKRSSAPGTPDFRLFSIFNTSTLTLQNISVQNGQLADEFGGGAIAMESAKLFVDGGEFKNNQAGFGGAIEVRGSITSGGITREAEATIENTLFSNNRSTTVLNGGLGGGAIYSRGQLTINNGEFSNNQSASRGGAIIFQSRNDSVVRSALFTNNRAVSGGGAIGVSAFATVSIYDSTISGNTTTGSTSSGAGIGASGREINVRLTNTTISNNSARERAGVSFNGRDGDNSSFLNIVNSIISGNNVSDPNGEVEIQFSATMGDLNINNSLIGHSGLRTFQAFRNDFNGDNNIFATSDGDTPTPLNKILLPLAFNGGPTRTHALPSDSPAINSAIEGINIDLFVFPLYVPGCRGTEIGPRTPLPVFRVDQRGFNRPSGAACDIGAFEFVEDDSCYVIKAANQKVVVFCL